MKYHLKVSSYGYIYLFLPLITSYIVLITQSLEYFNIFPYAIIFVIYSLLIFSYVKLTYININDNNDINFNIFGIIKIKLEINDIVSIHITDRGFGLLALSSEKIIIVKNSSSDNKVILSLKNGNEFINRMQEIQPLIKRSAYEISSDKSKINKLAVLLVIIMILNILGVMNFNILYSYFGKAVVIGIIIINYIFMIPIISSLKNKK